jgi:hypothetical protein
MCVQGRGLSVSVCLRSPRRAAKYTKGEAAVDSPVREIDYHPVLAPPALLPPLVSRSPPTRAPRPGRMHDASEIATRVVIFAKPSHRVKAPMPACLHVGWAGLQVLSAGLLCPDKAHLFENFTWEAQAGGHIPGSDSQSPDINSPTGSFDPSGGGGGGAVALSSLADCARRSVDSCASEMEEEAAAGGGGGEGGGLGSPGGSPGGTQGAMMFELSPSLQSTAAPRTL